MKKSTKIILSIVGVGVIGAVAFILIKRFRNRPGPLPPPKPLNGGTTPYVPPKTSAYIHDAFPLMQGSSGNRVKALQKYLNDSAYWIANSTQGFKGDCGLVIDGKWGPLTEACWLRMRNVTDANQDKYIEKTYYDKWVKKYES